MSTTRDLFHLACRMADKAGCCNLPVCAFRDGGVCTMLCDQVVAVFDEGACECNPADRTGGGHDSKCPQFDPNADVEPVQW